MSLDKASITWGAKQLAAMVKNGKVNFDHIVQRSYVWERSRKSALIESMILGYPIPPVFSKRIDDGTGKRGGNIYYIMDGKQRLSTVKEFIYDEFSLTGLDPVTYFDTLEDCEITVDISGKRFSELPESLRDLISNVSFNVTYFDNLTANEERELFKRLNAGKPLSNKSRLLASCKDIEGLLDIGSHVLFNEMLTDKARANKNQVALVMKCHCMLTEKNIEDVSFESKDFNPMLENTEIDESEKRELISVFDSIATVHTILVDRKAKKVAKKLYTESHMVSLIPYFKQMIEMDIEDEMIADWLIDFYGADTAASVSESYNVACAGGSAKTVNIVARHDALNDSFKSFFNDDSEVENDVDGNEEAEASEEE